MLGGFSVAFEVCTKIGKYRESFGNVIHCDKFIVCYKTNNLFLNITNTKKSLPLV